MTCARTETLRQDQGGAGAAQGRKRKGAGKEDAQSSEEAAAGGTGVGANLALPPCIWAHQIVGPRFCSAPKLSNLYCTPSMSTSQKSVNPSDSPTLSDTKYLLISFRKSTPPQSRQLNI